MLVMYFTCTNMTVINKNITNIFTSLYYIYMYLLQSMLYMHIVTLYVLQITVTFTNETYPNLQAH